MLIPILHPNPDRTLVESGIALGKAMQVVNIIRDIGADQKLGRRYIPLEIMKKHHYTELQWEQKVINHAFQAIIGDLTDQADQTEGLLYVDHYPDKSALTLRLATSYYQEIIKVVKENRYQVFHKRAIVTNQRKAKLLMMLTK